MDVEKFGRGVYIDGQYITRQDDALGNYIYCPKCRRPLYKTYSQGYYARCLSCKEDFFLSDVEHDGVETPVSVGRPPEGITLNAGMGIEYLLDDNNSRMIFPNSDEAAKFLCEQGGVDEGWLGFFYYIDVAMQEELDNFCEKSDKNKEK